MPTFKMTVSYDGTDFIGWQRQASGTSIQRLLEDALRELDGRDVAVAGAGRTDAGVHALGQVASFSLERTLPSDTIVRAMNARLPESVRVLAVSEAPDAFHARFDARTKTYRYRIWNGPVASPFERRYVWHVIEPLDVAAMDAAAKLLVGKHDFAAFQGSGSSTSTTVREVIASRVWKSTTTVDTETDGGFPSDSTVTSVGIARFSDPGGSAVIVVDISADGFLRHMVRAIVGTLVEIGRGRRKPEWMSEVIASRDRAAAGQTAPAAGLFLVRVDY